MRGFKRSLIGLIILILLGGYYYFYEIRYRGEKAKEKEISEKIYPIESANVTKIVYQREQDKIVLIKKNGSWEITEPVRTPADKKTVESLVNTFVKLKSFRKLTDVKWTDPDFGLTKGAVKVTLFTQKGETVTATFGKKNPTNSYVYTLKGKDKTVLLVWVYPKKLLSETLYDFRFKKILPLKASDVTSVKFEKGPTKIELQKVKEHTWKIVSPIKAEGDRYAIEGFIASATDEKVVRFLDNPPDDRDKFDWDHPRMSVTLRCKTSLPKEAKNEKSEKTSSSKEKIFTILVGKNRDEHHVYVKVVGRPTVMIVKNKYVKELDKNVFDFRNKNVWDYEIDDVKRVKYEDPEKHLTIEAKKFPEEDVWKLVQPKKTLADTRAVENWLWDLSGFRAKQFLSPEEFQTMKGDTTPATRTFEIEAAGKPPLKLTLYHLKDRWIARKNTSPWYYVLDPKDVEKTFKTVFDLKYRRLVKFEDTEVAKVEIKKGDETHLFIKKKNLWYQKTDHEDKKIPNIDVLNFLWELSDLKYTKLLQKPVKHPSTKPRIEIAIFDKDNTSLGHLFFGETEDGQAYYFHVEGKKQDFLIDKSHIKKFKEAYRKLTQRKEKEE